VQGKEAELSDGCLQQRRSPIVGVHTPNWDLVMLLWILKKQRLHVSVSWVMKSLEESYPSSIWNPVDQIPRTISKQREV